MKISRLGHKIKTRTDGTRLVVRGDVAVSEEGHRLPFYYEIDPDKDFDHEAHLQELERQGKQLVACDAPLRAWAGYKETIEYNGESVDIEISDCQMMFHAHSTWNVYVGWWETYEGERSHHQATWPCKEPNHGPKVEEVQQHVYTLVQMRLGHYSKASDHRSALSSLAVRHPSDDGNT